MRGSSLRQTEDRATLFSALLEERAPQPFDFRTTARSHGWVALPPIAWDAEREELSRTVRLASGAVAQVRMRGGPEGRWRSKPWLPNHRPRPKRARSAAASGGCCAWMRT